MFYLFIATCNTIKDKSASKLFHTHIRTSPRVHIRTYGTARNRNLLPVAIEHVEITRNLLATTLNDF